MPLLPSSPKQSRTISIIAMHGLTPFVLYLLLFHPLAGKTEGMEVKKQTFYPMNKINFRKLMMENALMDYDYAVANPKHDPKKGKPGGGKNP